MTIQAHIASLEKKHGALEEENRKYSCFPVL